MKRLSSLFLCAAVAAMFGCETAPKDIKKTVDQATRDAARKAEELGEKAEQAMENAAEKGKEMLDDAAKKVEDAVDKAKDALNNASDGGGGQ